MSDDVAAAASVASGHIGTGWTRTAPRRSPRWTRCARAAGRS